MVKEVLSASEKRRQYNKAYQLKLKNDPKRLNNIRARWAVNTAKKRITDKSNTTTSVNNSTFNTISARFKAITKAAKALPKNAAKAKEVLIALNNRHGAALKEQSPVNVVRMQKKGYEEIDDIVRGFFECDIITRQLPGVKDFVTIKTADGKKEKVQTRLLLMTMEKAHAEFVTMFPSQQLSFSHLCKLRSKLCPYVALSSTTKHSTCLCPHCANHEFLFDGLKQHMIVKKDLKAFLPQLVCDRKSFHCMTNSCGNCKEFMVKIKENLISSCEDMAVKYQQWMEKDKFQQLVTFTDQTTIELLMKIQQNFPAYKLHIFNVFSQHAFITQLKLTQPPNSAIIVMDYAQNYECRSQNESQTAYFGRRQASLFTSAAYVGQNKPQCFAILNDNLTHNAAQVHFYQGEIIKLVKLKHPDLKHVSFYSDGCAQQFKNKFYLSNLQYSELDFGVTSEAHFSASFHGKSICDGIGGCLKRNVYAEVLRGTTNVYNASQFVQCASKFTKNITVFEIKQSDVDKANAKFKERWENAVTVKGTRAFHSFKVSGEKNFLDCATSSLGYGLKKERVMKNNHEE